jgi:predicted RNA-binding protein with PUA-like domain
MQYWIMKSEPSSYSIDNLARDKKTPWDGVRNYQARNFMKNDMHIGDTVFFYHSACKEPGIVGIASVCSEAYPDKTALMEGGKYYDPRATEDNPRWYLVDVCFKKKLQYPITLASLRTDTHLHTLPLLQRGNRLSVQPVPREQGEYILATYT